MKGLDEGAASGVCHTELEIYTPNYVRSDSVCRVGAGANFFEFTLN